MRFTETALPGSFVIDLDPVGDDRGFFARSFCRREFAAHGLDAEMVQANCAVTLRKGIVRGLHFQYPPASETKLVRCTRGAIFDVLVDLRPESPTYLRYAAVRLTADNRRSVYVPQRFAHGYQALEDETEAMYEVGAYYTADAEGGLAYGDPAIGIEWPLPVIEVSAKDRSWPPLSDIEPHIRARMARSGTDLSSARA
jgi:dTDP-4-dehydrorhamnose 3,5-epimerase